MRLWVLFSVLSACKASEMCTGDDFVFDLLQSDRMISRQVLFTPRSPLRPARMVMDEDGTLDPQFRITRRRTTVKILSVTKDYEGAYSVFWPGNKTHHLVTLRVKDCPVYSTVEYGDSFFFDIVSRTVDQIDFSPANDGPVTGILWNRTKAMEGSRGSVTMGNRKFVVKRLTQTDQGFYTVRGKEGQLLKKYHISVKEKHGSYIFDSGEDLTITYPLDAVPYSLTYEPMYEASRTLIQNGHLIDSERFERRIELLSTGVVIRKLEARDDGTFKLQDSDGNQALVVYLNVNQVNVAVSPSDFGMNYISIMGAVVVVIVICLCCAKRCCCRNRNRNSSTTIAQSVPQVYHHEMTTNDQRQSQPYTMVVNQPPYNPHTPLAPAANKQPQASESPPPYDIVVGDRGDLGPSSEFATPAHVGPIPFQGSAAGGVDAPSVTQGFDCLSSDSGTQFELNYPSAAPLSSDTPFYTSDKLNFL